jgi:hypothetical protein
MWVVTAKPYIIVEMSGAKHVVVSKFGNVRPPPFARMWATVKISAYA